MCVLGRCLAPPPSAPTPPHSRLSPAPSSAQDFNHDSGPAWEAAFTNTYAEFVANATARYRDAKLPIFVAQGPMNNGAPLYNALQAAIAAINAAGGNAMYLDMRGPPNDGCGGHPGVEGHKGMFTLAQPVIAKAMGW